MTVPFLRTYSQLLIQTCHRRGAFAMGGMAAQIPIRGDDAANEAALAKVRADKKREAGDGHDGTWVAHPGAGAPGARGIRRGADRPQPVGPPVARPEDHRRDLLVPARADITEAGVRKNISVSIQYLAAWLNGNGCVPINQPDGRCRHRRNRPHPVVAMGPAPRPAG